VAKQQDTSWPRRLGRFSAPEVLARTSAPNCPLVGRLSIYSNERHLCRKHLAIVHPRLTWSLAVPPPPRGMGSMISDGQQFITRTGQLRPPVPRLSGRRSQPSGPVLARRTGLSESAQPDPEEVRLAMLPLLVGAQPCRLGRAAQVRPDHRHRR